MYTHCFPKFLLSLIPIQPPKTGLGIHVKPGDDAKSSLYGPSSFSRLSGGEKPGSKIGLHDGTGAATNSLPREAIIEGSKEMFP